MASRRYQSTRQGKFKHAARQQRYRDRRKNVTHHTSPDLPHRDVLIQPNKKPNSAILADALSCHFCGHACDEFLRVGFLQQKSCYLSLGP